MAIEGPVTAGALPGASSPESDITDSSSANGGHTVSMSVEDLEERWIAIDAQLARGELDSSEAIEALGEAGLVRRARAFGITAGTMWVAQPVPGALVPGPRLVVDFGELYGGPRIYRPVRDLMLPDTGIISERVPG